MTYEEAVALVTAPGELFETTAQSIGGIEYCVFKEAPPNLRAIFELARMLGDKTFLVYEGERWSFAEVMRHADALGSGLVNRYGVKKGDRVAIAMRNLPEWVVSYAAILSVGAVCVSLNAWWSESELDYALSDSEPDVLIADPSRAKHSAAACERLGIPMIVARQEDGDGVTGAARWEEVLQLGDPMPDVEVDSDEDATILYTSGTTGPPKGAISTHRAIIQALMAFGCVAAIQQARHLEDPGYGEDPCLILAIPLFHVTGCIPVMLASFTAGMRLVIMHHWDAEAALELIEREKVTALIGVPTQTWDLLQSPNFSKHDTSSLLIIAGGGAPVPPALVERVAEGFPNGGPTIGYGMTETNAYGPANVGEDYLTHPTSAGRTVPIVQLEIRDEDAAPLSIGEHGEIWMKGPNIIRGYLGKPEETSETLVQGWLRTGDVGHLDSEGFLYVEDRIKDVVLRGGENIYCPEVEAAIYELPAVFEVAVFGIPDNRLGEELAAVITLRPGETLTAEEVKAHVASRLAAFKVPSVVIFSDQPLPRSPAGKIVKRHLKDTYLAQLGAAGSSH